MKKIIDEHGRVFGKLSIIDFFVILIVLCVGAALYVKFDVLQATSVTASTDKITYQISLTGVRSYTVDALKAGDSLYDKSNGGGYAIGVIKDVQVTDAKKAVAILDGTTVLGNYIGRYDVTLTVEADGSRSNGRYLVNKTYELNAGSSRTFYTKYCTFEATIAEIS